MKKMYYILSLILISLAFPQEIITLSDRKSIQKIMVSSTNYLFYISIGNFENVEFSLDYSASDWFFFNNCTVYEYLNESNTIF